MTRIDRGFISISVSLTLLILLSSATSAEIGTSDENAIISEYLNEFSNTDETSTVNSTIKYIYAKGSLQDSFFSIISFYSYCKQTCIIIPFDVTAKKFFDKQTLIDIFKSKNAVESVRAGKITENAYTFSKGFDLCNYYGIDVLEQQTIGLGEELSPSFLPENAAKMANRLKRAGIISQFSPTTFIVSASCSVALKEEEEVFNKIASCRGYLTNLKNGFAYYGIVEDLKNCNKEAIQKIDEAKGKLLVQGHSFVQAIVKPFTPIINFVMKIYNCLLNKCQLSDISIGTTPDKTNMEIFEEASAAINKNIIQLSESTYDGEATLAVNRIAEKSNETDVRINIAIKRLNELNSLIPFPFVETISNLIKEPEIDYTNARIKQQDAEHYLAIAKEYATIYKFNSAIKNSMNSTVQSKEGIELANIEGSKDRHFKSWIKLFGIIIIVLVLLLIKTKSRK